jgi:hypothetical protein
MTNNMENKMDAICDTIRKIRFDPGNSLCIISSLISDPLLTAMMYPQKIVRIKRYRPISSGQERG